MIRVRLSEDLFKGSVSLSSQINIDNLTMGDRKYYVYKKGKLYKFDVSSSFSGRK